MQANRIHVRRSLRGSRHVHRRSVWLCSRWTVCTAVLPDLYLPHDEMLAVARQNASNPLLQGRGQPGTHDVALGTSLLHAIRALSATSDTPVHLPVYDKSAWQGAGDRAPTHVTVHAPLDVVLFEGWCLGMHALDTAALHQRMTDAPLSTYTFADLAPIQAELHVWEQQWYPLLDAFIQFCPQAPAGASRWSLVYPWRVQAEHAMKQRNGGHGMTDDQVAAFVER